MSQVTETQTISVVKGDDFKVINKNVIILRRFMRNKLAVFGLGLFVLMFLFGMFGQHFTSYTPTQIDYMALGEEPSATHFFGTNAAGNDLYAQMVEGVRVSLLIGLVVGTTSIAISAVYGCIMAYFGGWIDKVMLFILETMIMVPSLLILAISMNSGIGKEIQKNVPAWIVLSAVLIIFNWMSPARLIRAMGQSLIGRDYVKGARYMGVHPFKIVLRHLIPNIGSLLIIYFVLGVVGTVMSETALSFLGLGVKLPDVSLGTLLTGGTASLVSTPWQFYFPAAVLTLLTVSMALIADGLRDALDPNSKSGGNA